MQKIGEWIDKVPLNTVEVKKQIAAEVGVDIDTVNRWYKFEEVNLSVNNAINLFRYLRGWFPELEFGDVFLQEDATSDLVMP